MYKNERILDPRYVPDALQCRDDEIEKLNRIIVRRVNSDIVPKHVMIVGSTGSGKTVCVKHVLGEVKNKKGVLCSYLVADTSIYQILKNIASNFGIETSNRLINTNEYWTKIEERVKGNIAIIILCRRRSNIDAVTPQTPVNDVKFPKNRFPMPKPSSIKTTANTMTMIIMTTSAII